MGQAGHRRRRRARGGPHRQPRARDGRRRRGDGRAREGPRGGKANDSFQAAAKDLDAFAATRADAPLAFKNFHRSIQDTLAPHAAKLARELNDPKAHPAQVDADLELLGSYDNNLVQATNTLLEAEARGQLD